jgi:hypothetical protein
VVVRCRIGWSNLDRDRDLVCARIHYAKNEHELTAEAAVAVAALLIHHLQGAVVETVLQIGSGGDYLVRLAQEVKPIQMEVSGILEDETGSLSRTRLTKKREQVLTNERVGFASVTAFSHGPERVVHSHLHFTKRGKGGRPT